nr:immunoglobulin light chain junction region [Macaca mulatta]MOY06947.1 immunoglobulin light chain junction region [Macaca mulatta]MOY07333.1 immunoglobulin light chain junction region [Macaca mulatta]
EYYCWLHYDGTWVF